MLTINRLADVVNTQLLNLNLSKEPTALYEPIKYSLSLGGKRIRPVLMMMAYQMYKEELDEVIMPAVGIEIYHNHTLLHDDVMDKSDMRRGKPTVHKVWDENCAILSGDAMLILAYKCMQQCPVKVLPEVLQLFTNTTLEICEGQQMDMDFEHRLDVKENDYIEMIRLKTAVLLAASLKIGGMIGGADPSDLINLYLFGQNMGLAFQLRDDLLDVYGNPKTFGKNIGGDILANKKTYMLIQALQNADTVQIKELFRWLDMKNYYPEAKIEAVTNLYNEIGVKEICQQKIDYYTDEAMRFLQDLHVEEPQKQQFRDLLSKMVDRES